jgi:hypothetical protein
MSDYPMPGQTDFSADEEKAMQNSSKGEAPADETNGLQWKKSLRYNLNAPAVPLPRPRPSAELDTDHSFDTPF